MSAWWVVPGLVVAANAALVAWALRLGWVRQRAERQAAEGRVAGVMADRLPSVPGHFAGADGPRTAARPAPARGGRP